MNDIYFPGMNETDKAKLTQYITINNEKTGKPDKIQLGTLINALSISTDTTPTTNITSVTYAEAQTLITNSELITGDHYLISDKADNGIVLLAISNNQFSLEGQGIFLNPDFQNAILPTSGYTSVGVWHSGLLLLIAESSVAFWNGIEYINLTGLVGTQPDGDAVNWIAVSKTVNPELYVEEVDFILYDFANDKITNRIDKRNNNVRGYCAESADSAIDVFQWGNDEVSSNIVEHFAKIDCLNNRGKIVGNTVSLYINLNITELNVGELYNNVISGQYTITANFNSFISLSNCNIFANFSFVFDSAVSYDSETLNSLGSTFEADLDISDAGVFLYNVGIGTLTIPTALNYVGIFNLTNSAADNITYIENLPLNHKSRFYCSDGTTVGFIHTAIATILIPSNELISDGAATNTIVGRTNGSDFMEYEKAGDLNRRYNAVIAA